LRAALDNAERLAFAINATGAHFAQMEQFFALLEST
jgi:hypothetical protein